MTHQQKTLAAILKDRAPTNSQTGGVGSAYYLGKLGFKNRYPKSSLAYTAWKAGRDAT